MYCAYSEKASVKHPMSINPAVQAGNALGSIEKQHNELYGAG